MKKIAIEKEDIAIRIELSGQIFNQLESPPPILSLKPLFGDVRDMIHNGDYIILKFSTIHAKYFHTNCPGAMSKMSRKEMAIFTRKNRIITIDLQCIPQLVNDDEWPRHIKKMQCQECQCPLKEYMVTCKDVSMYNVSLPDQYFYLLGLDSEYDLCDVTLVKRSGR
jgi:hypothetical protein